MSAQVLWSLYYNSDFQSACLYLYQLKKKTCWFCFWNKKDLQLVTSSWRFRFPARNCDLRGFSKTNRMTAETWRPGVSRGAWQSITCEDVKKKITSEEAWAIVLVISSRDNNEPSLGRLYEATLRNETKRNETSKEADRHTKVEFKPHSLDAWFVLDKTWWNMKQRFKYTQLVLRTCLSL